MSFFSDEFIRYLDQHADIIDQESGRYGDALLERIGAEGAFRVGVPESLGGSGGGPQDVVELLSELAQHSLTAAFISWGHRTFIDNILHSANPYYRDHYLDRLLTGDYAGATALSNAVKFLSELEELNVTIRKEEGGYKLYGRLPWVTNARARHFITIFVAGFEGEDRPPLVLAVPSHAANFHRSRDLEFVSLQGSNTAALSFDGVDLDDNWLIAEDAEAFLKENRPNFLGFQFGLAFGLAEKSLSEVARHLDRRQVLEAEYEANQIELQRITAELYQGLESSHYFVDHPRELFQLRIDIVDVVAQSLLLELQAGGGSAYFKAAESGFIRRWNEGAFLPIVSPSAVQLRHILQTT
ncbi:acyl-CoA dehydrogenase family protein [Aerococcus sp. UMB1112A]|uniref:acyl-CoA dehydrogenase family protein n=1 Tax=Aerococcus sp. UMB1112A TaxID=3050609 RepID=UPI0025504930|nr:acyl-CoA dehydrogenase family protein [Aerococcus sp. UMB1112A]MDK8502834.1 acyl-CoA dehydrogenase family protein [Aerococcus sp. UMB1112A]